MKKAILFALGIVVTTLANTATARKKPMEDGVAAAQDASADQLVPAIVEKTPVHNDVATEEISQGQDNAAGQVPVQEISENPEDTTTQKKPLEDDVTAAPQETIVQKPLHHYGNYKFSSYGINRLKIQSRKNQKVFLSIVGTQEPYIKIDTRDKNQKNFPSLMLDGKDAVLNLASAPSSRGYTLSIPHDMDVSYAGDHPNICIQNMTGDSLLHINGRKSSSCNIVRKKSDTKTNPNGFVSNTIRWKNTGPRENILFGNGNSTNSSSVIMSWAHKISEYENILQNNYDRFVDSPSMPALITMEEECRKNISRASAQYLRDVFSAFPAFKKLSPSLPSAKCCSVFQDLLHAILQVESPGSESNKAVHQKIKKDILLQKEKRQKFLQLQKTLEKKCDLAFQEYTEKVDQLPAANQKASESIKKTEKQKNTRRVLNPWKYFMAS